MHCCKQLSVLFLCCWLGIGAAAQPFYSGAIRLEFHSETAVNGVAQDSIAQLRKAAYIQADPASSNSLYGDRTMELGRLEFFERSDEPCAVAVTTSVDQQPQSRSRCGKRP